MYAISLMLISAILAAFSAISLVKNFLVNFNISDNGWKTALIAVLIAICLFCALFGYTEAYTIRDISVMPPSSGETEDDIEQLRALIPQKTINTNISVCIGYAAYFLHILLIKNIRKNKQKEAESSADRRWTRKV